MKNVSKEWLATIIVISSGVCYGFLGFFGTKLIELDYSISNMLFWRFFIALLWIVGMMAIRRRKIQMELKPAFVTILVILNLGYVGSSAFYFVASAYTGTGVAMVVFFSFPIFVAMLAYFIDGWPITLSYVLALIAIVVGLIFLEGDLSDAFHYQGLLYALLSAFSYAIYIFFNKGRYIKIDSNSLTVFICLGNALLFMLIALYHNDLNMPKSMQEWFYVVCLGVIITALPIQMMLIGLRYINPVKASILSVFEPLVTMFAGLLLLNETITFQQYIGAIIVLSSIILVQFKGDHAHRTLGAVNHDH